MVSSARPLTLPLAEVVLCPALLVLTGIVAWKHGKPGLVCWSSLLVFFIIHLVASIYQLAKLGEPFALDYVLSTTAAGGLVCLSSVLIGLVYEANAILPHFGKGRKEKIALAILQLIITVGVAMATIGGTPSAAQSPTGFTSQTLNIAGTSLLLLATLAVCAWLAFPTGKRYRSVRNHPHANHKPVGALILTAGLGAPLQIALLLERIVAATEAGSGRSDLFYTRAMIQQLFTAVIFAAGGWFSRHISPHAMVMLESEPGDLDRGEFDRPSEDAVPQSHRLEDLPSIVTTNVVRKD